LLKLSSRHGLGQSLELGKRDPASIELLKLTPLKDIELPLREIESIPPSEVTLGLQTEDVDVGLVTGRSSSVVAGCPGALAQTAEPDPRNRNGINWFGPRSPFLVEHSPRLPVGGGPDFNTKSVTPKKIGIRVRDPSQLQHPKTEETPDHPLGEDTLDVILAEV